MASCVCAEPCYQGTFLCFIVAGAPFGINGANSNSPFKCPCVKKEFELWTATAGKSGASVKQEGGSSATMLKASGRSQRRVVQGSLVLGLRFFACLLGFGFCLFVVGVSCVQGRLLRLFGACCVLHFATLWRGALSPRDLSVFDSC